MADGFFERTVSLQSDARAQINGELEYGASAWSYLGDETESVKSSQDNAELIGSVPKTVSTKYGNGSPAKPMGLLDDSIVPPALAPYESQGPASEAMNNASDVDVGSVEKTAEAVEVVIENEDTLRTLPAISEVPTVCASEESESGSVSSGKDESNDDVPVVVVTNDDTFVLAGTIEDAEDARKNLNPSLLTDNSEATSKATNFFSGIDEVGVERFDDTYKAENADVHNKSVVSDRLPVVRKSKIDVRREGIDFTVVDTFKERGKNGDTEVRVLKFVKDVIMKGGTAIRAGESIVEKVVKTCNFRKTETEVLTMGKFGRSVTALHAVGRSGERTIMFQKLVDGELLHDVMQRSKEKPLNEIFLYHLSYAMVEAYRKLYENNFVHLDIKPKNMIIRANDVDNGIDESKELELCVLDFGLSRDDANEIRNKPSDVLCGSASFMSPLVARNIMVSVAYKHLTQYCLMMNSCLASHPKVRDNEVAAREFDMIGSVTSADTAGNHHSDESCRTEKKPQGGSTNGGNIPARSSIKMEKKQEPSEKAATKSESIKRRILRMYFLNPSQYVDGPSFALSLDAAARGHPFFQPPSELTFKKAVAWRCEQEKAKFNEYNGELTESSYLDELKRLESDGVSEEERQRFPKWLVQLLRALYNSSGVEDVAKILELVHKERF